MLKILQARLQHYMSHEFPDVQAGFRKGRGTRDEIANIPWSLKKQKSSRKTSSSTLLTMLKALTMWITTNCGKSLKRCEYPTTLPASWEICMQVKKQQLELDMEQKTCSKSEKEYFKAVYCHPAYLTYMQSTSCKMLGWTNHKPESRLLEKIATWKKYQQPQICRWYHFNGRKWRGAKETVDEGERGEWESWLETQHSKN